MDKLLAMSTFVQIVDSGSLTAAAEVLEKSLPSVVRVLATQRTNLRREVTKQNHAENRING